MLISKDGTVLGIRNIDKVTNPDELCYYVTDNGDTCICKKKNAFSNVIAFDLSTMSTVHLDSLDGYIVVTKVTLFKVTGIFSKEILKDLIGDKCCKIYRKNSNEISCISEINLVTRYKYLTISDLAALKNVDKDDITRLTMLNNTNEDKITESLNEYSNG